MDINTFKLVHRKTGKKIEYHMTDDACPLGYEDKGDYVQFTKYSSIGFDDFITDLQKEGFTILGSKKSHNPFKDCWVNIPRLEIGSLIWSGQEAL